MLRPRVIAAACALGLVIVGATAPAGQAAPRTGESRVVLAFWTQPLQEDLLYPPKGAPSDLFLQYLGARKQLSLGLMGTSVGPYKEEQALLDISQGTRQAPGVYPNELDQIEFIRHGDKGSIYGWGDAVKRAHDASVTIKPGLLASSVPGGAGYVGVVGQDNLPAIAAANEQGNVPDVSIGTRESVLARTQASLRRNRLVVVGLPDTDIGSVDQLVSARKPNEQLIFTYLPPTPPKVGFGKPPGVYLKLSDMAIARSGKVGALTSSTTRHDGVVASIDLMPTILRHLGVPLPEKARGAPIKIASRISAKDLDNMRNRFSAVRAGRQKGTLKRLIMLDLMVLLLLGVARGLRGAIRPTLRITALGFLWWPTGVLLTAALQPKHGIIEITIVAFFCLIAAILTDRFLSWPRGPIAPAVVGLTLLTIDLAFGGELLTRSVIGPSVLAGSRYYGISNELEPLLPILLFAGLAGYFWDRPKSRRLAMIFAGWGLLLLVIVGWGRLGADVGGVITVGFGTAVGTLFLLPGPLTRRRVLITALVPVGAIAFLILLDLVTSGGDHLSRNLTRSQGTADLLELVTRRYVLAWRQLQAPNTIVSVLAAALAVWFAIRNRGWLYASWRNSPMWMAAMAGGLGAAIGGALTNDSGPILFINGIVALAALTAYGQGVPAGEPERAPPSTKPPPPAERSEPEPALTS